MKILNLQEQKHNDLTVCSDNLSFTVFLLQRSRQKLDSISDSDIKFDRRLSELHRIVCKFNCEILFPYVIKFVNNYHFHNRQAKNFIRLSLRAFIICPTLSESPSKFYDFLSEYYKNIGKQEFINVLGNALQLNPNVLSPITKIDDNYEPKSIHKALCGLFSAFLDDFCD